MRLDPHDTVRSSALRSSLKSWPELQIRITQLAREGSPPPRLRLLQAKLSRKSNQIARGRIRQFESDMPSQAVRQHRAEGCCEERRSTWNKPSEARVVGFLDALPGLRKA